MCLALAEAREVEAWGAPTFRANNRIFAMYSDGGTHHGRGRHGAWVKATAVNQGLMLKHAPDRFFFPPYVGTSGWIGVWLDAGTDWDELSGLLDDAHRMVSPRRPPRIAPAKRARHR